MRNTLAAERTTLANERTLLAYVRTALTMAVTGLALLHLFAPWIFVVTVGTAMLGLAAVIAAVGFVRYFKTRRRIGELMRASASETRG